MSRRELDEFHRTLGRFASFIRRAVWVETLDIRRTADGAVLVTATWNGGTFEKVYEVTELSRVCRVRRGIISDLLEARQPLKD